MSQQPYSLVPHRNGKGKLVKYSIVDKHGVALGTATPNRYCGFDVKYHTSRSEVEFLSYCDSLSASETVEALVTHL